jgi:5-methyltetrahydropteroyltriglutamate--homocysteine methyltransferase
MPRPGLAAARTDHVGSFLRPEALKAAFLAHAKGRKSRAELRAAQDGAIRALVAEERAHGVIAVTDGEYRRLNWQVSFSEVTGWDLWPSTWANFVKAPDNVMPGETPGQKGGDAVVSFRTPATAKLALAENFPLGELKFLKTATDGPAKITLMGPDRVCQMCDVPASKAIYADADAFLADVVAIHRKIIGELIDAGCDYIQLDEPSYTGYVDPPTLARMAAEGQDPLRALRRAIDADNAAIAGVAGRAVTGLHICRGNRASMWHREGGYDPIAEAVFGGLKFDRLLLEYDTSRAGGFEPLRYVTRGPAGPVVVLGLVTTKTGAVETVDALRRRIDDAARFVPLDQLAISPQCGFASGIAGNMLTMDEQWRKMDVLAETARKVWG